MVLLPNLTLAIKINVRLFTLTKLSLVAHSDNLTVTQLHRGQGCLERGTVNLLAVKTVRCMTYIKALYYSPTRIINCF